MGFGYFKSEVVLIRARRSCLYHTCKKNVFSSKYMIKHNMETFLIGTVQYRTALLLLYIHTNNVYLSVISAYWVGRSWVGNSLYMVWYGCSARLSSESI